MSLFAELCTAAICEAAIKTARTKILIARLAEKLATLTAEERLSRIRLKISVSPSHVCAADGKLMPEGIVGQIIGRHKMRAWPFR